MLGYIFASMDRPSQWEWPWKLLAIVLFGLAIAAAWWVAHKAAFEWIPESAVGYVAVAFMAFCAGGLFGRWLLARELRDQGSPDRR